MGNLSTNGGHELSLLQDESHKQQRFHNHRGFGVQVMMSWDVWEILQLLCIPPTINQGATIIKNAYALSRNFHGRRVGRVHVIHCRKGDSRYSETCLFGSSKSLKKKKHCQEQVLPQEGLVESVLSAIMIY